MVEVGTAATLHAEMQKDSSPPGKNEGLLKIGTEEYTIYPIGETESISEGVFKFLQEANQSQELPSLAEHLVFYFSSEVISNELEILHLLEELKKPEDQKGEMAQPSKGSAPQLQNGKTSTVPFLRPFFGQEAKPQSQPEGHVQQDPVVYSSLFTLARSFSKPLNHEGKVRAEERGRTETSPLQDSRRSQAPALAQPQTAAKETYSERSQQQEKEKQEKQKEDQEGSGEHSRQQQDEETQKQKKKKFGLGKVEVAASGSKGASSQVPNLKADRSEEPPPSGKSRQETLQGVENIYIRFMALMARMLSQSEAEAHQLYLKIKDRTDNIDVLTLLVSKINSSKGDIDWSKNEEMKQLVDKVRTLGVDIPEGKYTWTEDEKKLLKENIQMRKDSMEKITQLERTDMQRYLQEASQCHQARSNVLKLLKEVIDTIIHNMRS